MRPGDSWRRYAFRSLGASFRRSRGTCVKQHEKSGRVQCQPRSHYCCRAHDVIFPVVVVPHRL